VKTRPAAGRGVGKALPGLVAIVFLLWFCADGVEKHDAGSVLATAAASPQDPTPCNRLLHEAEEVGLVRYRPSANRIDVDDRLWAQLPAGSKRGILLALRCSVLDGRRDAEPLGAYTVAYGYGSGRRLAMATSVGVSFE
jgi:hypothetical protein